MRTSSSLDRGFCFFFQAEDGIRDADVTGVQTCALPILSTAGSLTSESWPCRNRTPCRWPRSSLPAIYRRKKGRSEERRVGKECRCRWAQHHQKKKGNQHVPCDLPTHLDARIMPLQGRVL